MLTMFMLSPQIQGRGGRIRERTLSPELDLHQEAEGQCLGLPGACLSEPWPGRPLRCYQPSGAQSPFVHDFKTGLPRRSSGPAYSLDGRENRAPGARASPENTSSSEDF